MRVIYPGRGLALLCQLLGHSRQAYYKVKKHREDKAAFYAIVAELVSEVRTEIGNFKIGARKLLPLINEKLSGNTLSIEAERVWASDITYIRVKGRFLYLNLITDCYSRKIMGYCLHPDLSAEGTLKALLMALGNRQYPTRRLIHHSDRGIQYCSQVYINMLKTHGISISMSAKGSPQENPLAERVNGILKDEYDLGKQLDNEDKALQKVESSVGSYNLRRPHNSLDDDTPQQRHNEDNWKQDLGVSRSTQSRIKQMNVNAEKDKSEACQPISGPSITKTTQ